MTKTAAEWLTRKEAAAYLTSIGCSIAAKTLANLACRHGGQAGPPYVARGWRTVRYRRADLDDWAAHLMTGKAAR